MKAISRFLLVATAFLAVPSFADFPHRRDILRAAEGLDRAIEGFDNVLHALAAPKHVTDKVHHADESIETFVEELDRGDLSLAEAEAEFNHIKQDLDAIAKELDEHPEILRTFQSRSQWRSVRRAYRNLYHEIEHAHHHH